MLKIIIDTREQTPWCWPEELATTRRATVNAGDYAIDGDLSFAIERKNLDDFASTMASGWDRFNRELDRMSDSLFPARVIIVEGTVAEIIDHQYSSPKVTPKFLFKRIGQLTMRNITVLFAGTPEASVGLAFAIFCERDRELRGVDQ
jgi:ERCC4-type nuclease